MITGYPLRADNVKDAEECGRVTLLEAEPDSLADFKIAPQDSFRVAAEADLGHPLEEHIPSNEDVENSFNIPGSIIYWIVAEERRVGGGGCGDRPTEPKELLVILFHSDKPTGSGLGTEGVERD